MGAELLQGRAGRPSASALCGMWLSQQVLPLTNRGVGPLLSQLQCNTKMLFTILRSLALKSGPVMFSPCLVARLPSEAQATRSSRIEAEVAFLRTAIVGQSAAAIHADPQVCCRL